MGRARVLWLFNQELHNIQKTVQYNNYITAIYTPLDPTSDINFTFKDIAPQICSAVFRHTRAHLGPPVHSLPQESPGIKIERTHLSYTLPT